MQSAQVTPGPTNDVQIKFEDLSKVTMDIANTMLDIERILEKKSKIQRAIKRNEAAEIKKKDKLKKNKIEQLARKKEQNEYVSNMCDSVEEKLRQIRQDKKDE